MARHRNASEHSAMPDFKGWQIQNDPATDGILLVAPDGRETWNLANPENFDSYMKNSLFAFQFGAYGDTRVLIWEQNDHIESALEAAGEWLEKHAPGHLSDLKEEYEEALKEAREELGEDADEEDLQEKAQEIAETDKTYTEAGWLTSWELTVNEYSRGELFDVALHVSKTLSEEELEPNISADLKKRYEFFKTFGGGGRVGHAAEGSLALARAEKIAEDRGWEAEWSEEEEAWESFLGDNQTLADISEVLYCVLKDDKGRVLDSLGGIQFGHDSAENRRYRRYTEAELALEAAHHARLL